MKRLLLLWGLLALLTSCRPEIELVDGSFRSSQAEMTSSGTTATMLFTAEAGTATVDLEASKKWSASVVNDRASSWFKLSATEGSRGTVTLTISVSANTNYDERSASVVFRCDDAEQTLVVVQKQKDAILLTSDRVEIGAGGGTSLVSVSANITYTYRVDDDAKDWLSASRTKGMTSSSFQLTAAVNESLDPRQGTVWISSQLGDIKVQVYQQGERPTLVISEHKLDIDPEGAEFSVQVTSNLDVSVGKTDGCDWLREVSTKTISTNTYYFSVERNSGRSERSCQLIFRNEERGMADTVTVRQRFQPILLSTADVQVPGLPVFVILECAPGEAGDFKVVSSSSWLTFERVESMEDGGRIILQAAQNTRTTVRPATVKVFYRDYETPDEVKVYQHARMPRFSFETLRSEVTDPGVTVMGSPAFIIWGDGTYDMFVPGIRHRYDEICHHTVTVEAPGIPDVLFARPEDGMHLDFTQMTSRQ